VVRTEDGGSSPSAAPERRAERTTVESLLPNPVREAWIVGTAVVAVASGAAQLVVSGTGRVLLAALFLGTLAFLGIRLWRLYPADRLARLTDDLHAREYEIRRYRNAVERIVDRQFPLFEERVEITVAIGAASGDDVVTERHWTTPKPYLVYRLIRPITAVHGQVLPSYEELRLACEVRGEDVGLAILPVSETLDGILVLILFQPGLREETEWSLRYRAPRLWDPLRAEGYDHLGWTPSTRDGRGAATAITHLTVHFLFPPGARGAGVWERHDLGNQITVNLPSEQRRVTWVDDAPSATRYDWELVMSMGD
jgi:hypothetical protein